MTKEDMFLISHHFIHMAKWCEKRAEMQDEKISFAANFRQQEVFKGKAATWREALSYLEWMMRGVDTPYPETSNYGPIMQ